MLRICLRTTHRWSTWRRCVFCAVIDDAHYPHTCFTYSTHDVCFACLKPPAVLRPSETHTEQEDIEIQITKLLLKSYYDIVRKNIEDLVPKAIMHFLVSTSYLPEVAYEKHFCCLENNWALKLLIPFIYPVQVNHTKRELHNVFIKKLYRWYLCLLLVLHICVCIVSCYWGVISFWWCRENLFEEMLQEPDEIAGKRKRTQETLHILQQAYRVCSQLRPNSPH